MVKGLSPENTIEVSNAKKAMLDEIKGLAVRDALAAIERARARLDEARKSGDMDAFLKLKSKGATKDDHGRDITLWDDVIRHADRAIHSEQNSYNDWRSAMMSLLTMYSSMVKASDHDTSVFFAPVGMGAKQILRDNLAVPFKNKIVDWFKGQPKVDLPTLVHNVAFTDDNKLDLGLSRADGGADMGQELTRKFELLVDIWLTTQGYAPKKPGPGEDPALSKGIYVNVDTGDELTKDAFTALKNDDTNGLNPFLNEDTRLNFRPE